MPTERKGLFARLASATVKVLLGSAVASRATGAPVSPDELETQARADWATVWQETAAGEALAALPAEVRRYLPDLGDAEVDIATAVRLSYAAAQPVHFAALDGYWKNSEAVRANPAAERALEETRIWLAGPDGAVERAERQSAAERAAVGLGLGASDGLPDPLDLEERVAFTPGRPPWRGTIGELFGETRIQSGGPYDT